MASDLIPFYDDADQLTCHAAAALTARTAVKIAGNLTSDGLVQVTPCTATTDKVFGIAVRDAVISSRVDIVLVDSHKVVPWTATGAIAANDSVTASASAGCSTAATGVHASGIALTGATNGQDAKILLTRHDAP
jgi:hypothetical protein